MYEYLLIAMIYSNTNSNAITIRVSSREECEEVAKSFKEKDEVDYSCIKVRKL